MMMKLTCDKVLYFLFLKILALPVGGCSSIHSCAHAGRVDEALDLLSELRSNESKAAAAAAARGKGRGGQGGGDMRRALPVPNLVIYSSAIYACLKAGEVPRGTELLEEMIASGIPPNDIHCDAIIAA